MARPDWNGRTALITGASSGIGAAAARRLAAEGLTVALAARRADRLNALAAEICAAGGRALAFPCDLSDMAAREALAERVQRRAGPVDVLFNNAGLGWYGYFERMPWDIAAEMLALNVSAVAHLTRLFLDPMRARGRGHIINMGSLTGALPVQGAVIYGASKAFLESFTASVHRELAGTPVHISLIRAGAVRTEFFDTTSAQPGGQKLPGERGAVSVERVVAALWSLLQRPRRIVFVPWTVRFVPWAELLAGWVMDRVGPALLKRG